ncbi:MAG: NUMOD1 domain-containing DNA-binding protein [Flavobacterium sp.]
MEENNYFIYKATNRTTNQCYVGATTKSIKERRQDHFHKSETNNGYKFQNAISTYGKEVFVWEQIDTAKSIDELAKKEIQYIEEFDTISNGYNSDKGGGFKKTVYQFNFETGDLIDYYDDLSIAANAVNASKTSISNACLHYNKTCKGFAWSYSSTLELNSTLDFRKKTVSQFSLDGNFIAYYESASEASRKTGISKTCITRCCRNERLHSGGFLWEYS